MFTRTDRLLIRPGWSEDSAEIRKLLNDTTVCRNLPHIPASFYDNDAREIVFAPVELPEVSLLVFSHSTIGQKLVGGIGLRKISGAVELGYWIGRPFWGKGFATEASRALVRFARDGLRISKLTAFQSADNRASDIVLRRVGFRPLEETQYRYNRARRESVLCRKYEINL